MNLLVLKMQEEMQGLKKFWDLIGQTLSSNDLIERYRYQWRNSIQQICALSAFLYWIQDQNLVSKESIEQQTGRKKIFYKIVY